MKNIYHYHNVSERLSCAGQPTEEQLREIREGGFEAVVNLGLTDADYSLKDEKSSVESLGMQYAHIPVIFNKPQTEDLQRFFAVMEELKDKKVFVHCAANYRASSFVGLYLLKTGELAPGQVEDFIYDVWKPDAVWQPFIEEHIENMESFR